MKEILFLPEGSLPVNLGSSHFQFFYHCNKQKFVYEVYKIKVPRKTFNYLNWTDSGANWFIYRIFWSAHELVQKWLSIFKMPSIVLLTASATYINQEKDALVNSQENVISTWYAVVYVQKTRDFVTCPNDHAHHDDQGDKEERQGFLRAHFLITF